MACRPPPPARAKRRFAVRGFSLLELMVVVVVIGVLAAVAIPSMRIATYDRHAYADAGAILQIFREARLRAVARGGAMLLSMSASGTSDRGTFTIYEAVQKDPNDPSGAFQMPIASCKAPTLWAGPNQQGQLFIDAVNLNGNPEAEADIETTLYANDPNGNGGTSQSVLPALAICYSPLGRSYKTTTTPNTPTFSGAPMMSVIEARVTRANGAVVRSVIVEPNGMPRMLSKAL